jgi:hypothetical protein
MAKRVYDQDAGGRARKKASTLRDDETPASSTTCEYCDHKFTTRGLKKHQNHCKSKKAADKKPRSYKFCILNETLLEIILSFLNNQALTKMQMITGDRYPNCEPQLASCCCKCEEDSPVIRYGQCRECSTKGPYFNPYLTKEMAKEKYCLRDKDFKGIRTCHILGDGYHEHKRYNQKDLEMRAIALHGSKSA